MLWLLGVLVIEGLVLSERLAQTSVLVLCSKRKATMQLLQGDSERGEDAFGRRGRMAADAVDLKMLEELSLKAERAQPKPTQVCAHSLFLYRVRAQVTSCVHIPEDCLPQDLDFDCEGILRARP